MIQDPQSFARQWCEAWNRLDIEAVLGHFGDDVIFTSPIAQRVISQSDGRIRGKDALRDYWAQALARVPDLHFSIIDVYAGIDTLVIHYRNQRAAKVCEVLTFDGLLVREGHGTYLA